MIHVLGKILVIFVLGLSCEVKNPQEPENVETASEEIQESAAPLSLVDVKDRVNEVFYEERFSVYFDFNQNGSVQEDDFQMLKDYPNLSEDQLSIVYRNILAFYLSLAGDNKDYATVDYDVTGDREFDVSDLIVVRRVLSKKLNEMLMVQEAVSVDFKSVQEKIHSFLRLKLFRNVEEMTEGVDFNNDEQINAEDVVIWRRYVAGDLDNEAMTDVGASLLKMYYHALEDVQNQNAKHLHFDFNDSGRVEIADIRVLRNFMRQVRMRFKRRTKVRETIEQIKKLIQNDQFSDEQLFDFNGDQVVDENDVPYLDKFRSYEEPYYSTVYKKIMDRGLASIGVENPGQLALLVFDGNKNDSVDPEEVDLLLLLLAKESSEEKHQKTK